MAVPLLYSATASAQTFPSGVMAWGDNANGQLGDSSSTQSSLDTAVSGLTDVQSVAAGDGFALALLTNGTVVAWGDNSSGQLGDGSVGGDSDTPVPVSGLTGVKGVAAGGSHAMALLTNGTVMAWGDNSHGQLGDGSVGGDSDTPVPVRGLRTVYQIAAGGEFSLAIIPYGTVMAWGDNSSGQLGDGSVGGDSDTPVQVSGLRNDVQYAGVRAGEDFAFAVLGDGSVEAWGDDSEGQLGDGTMGGDSAVPVPVTGLSATTRLAAGEDNALAIEPGGDVVAWGDNSSGELGDGSVGADSDVPEAVPGLADALAVSAGSQFDLVLLDNGSVEAWGDDGDGQLGDGEAGGSSDVPVAVGDLSGVRSISAGSDFGLARAEQMPAVLARSRSARARVGEPFMRTIQARSHPTVASLTEAGALPRGITYTDNGNDTASLSGTPAAGSAGTYHLVITATDGLGSPSTESFVLRVLS